MHNASTGGFSQIRQVSGLQRAGLLLREQLTLPNLIGLSGATCALFLLIVLREPWNFRLPLYCVLLVWTMLRPRTALYLMVFAVPWGSLDIVDIAGLHVNSADILVVLLGSGWLMSFALRPTISNGGQDAAGPLDRENSTTPLYLVVAILLLIGTMALSMRGSLSISSSVKEVSKWLEFLVLVLVGSQYIRTRRQVWMIIVLILLGGITQAFFGFLKAFFNLGPEAFIRDTSLRVYGTFGQPNPFAGYLNLSLSVALALMLLGSTWLTRILAGLTSVLLAAAVYLTQSRGGEIAIAAALLFIMIVGWPHLRKLAALLALGGLVVVEVFFTGWIPTYVITPLLKYLGAFQISFTNPNSQDYSTAERLAHWIAGVRMFVDHPLTGVGIGNYPDAYSRYYVTIFVDSLGQAHNYYINIAAETGAIGLTAFLLFILAIFVAGGTAYTNINKKYKQSKAQTGSLPSKLNNIQAQAPLGTKNKLILLAHPLKMIAYYRTQGTCDFSLMPGNDRALAIGLLAALLSVCVHNLVDDLYVHSLTNLIALLLIALIRLDGVTKNTGGNGGNFDYAETAR